MMLIICDKNPYKATEYLIQHTNKSFVFKSLLELGQLICSAGISDVFKPIKQGKELQNFCIQHLDWIYMFFNELFIWAEKNIKMSETTHEKLCAIRLDIYFNLTKTEWQEPKTAIFRYVKEYAEFTEYESNSELPIDECVKQYTLYLAFKEKQWKDKKLTKKKV